MKRIQLTRFLGIAFLTAFLLCAVPSVGTAQESAAADRDFAAGNYAAAAAEYQKLIDSGVDVPRSWFELGASYQRLKQYDRAISAYNHALAIHYPPVNIYYQLGRIAAIQGRTDDAVASLTKMFDVGVMPVLAVTQQPDFASLLADARIVKLLDAQRRKFKPCLYEPEFRAMDFWIGDWDVENAAGGAAGTSHVELIMNKCIVFENWSGTYGDLGKSFSHYDTALKKWVQYYVNGPSFGTLWIGSAVNGSIVFLTDQPKGMSRMTFTPIADGRVRQLFELSVDGKTWKTSSDLYYTRKKG